MNRRTFSTSVAVMAGAALSASGNAAPQPAILPLTFTGSGKERKPFVGVREAVLLEHSGTGFLTHMWFGGKFPGYDRLRIRVYVDDESTASINMELGMGIGFGFSDTEAPWGTSVAGKTGDPSGIFNFYQIPFTSRIRVTAELPEGVPETQSFWWIVRGVENMPLIFGGISLPKHARMKLYTREGFTASPLEEFSLCQTEKSGFIVQVAMAAKSSNFEFLEGLMRSYIGKEDTPQILCSGLEDYFLGTYYFNRGIYHLPQGGLTHKSEQDYSFSAYRYHDRDLIAFQQGLRLTCRCGERIGEKTFGPHGDPHATTYTTYVWTYEW